MERRSMGNNFTNPQQRKNWNEYNKKYAQEHYRSFCLKFNKDTDKDVIEFLTNGQSPTQVIRALVKEKLGTGK